MRPVERTTAEERGYTIEEAARIVGFTRRQIEYLDATDVVTRTLVRPGGKRRYFRFYDLVELRTLHRLRADGQNSLQKVRRVVRELEKVRDRPLRTCTLISADGGGIFYVDEDSMSVVDVLRRHQIVIAVSLLGIEHEVRRELNRIGLDAPPLADQRAA
jgi:DNA-binding transcriptional MerR regulator